MLCQNRNQLYFSREQTALASDVNKEGEVMGEGAQEGAAMLMVGV